MGISAFAASNRHLWVSLLLFLLAPGPLRAEGQVSVYDLESKWVDHRGKSLVWQDPGIQWTVLSMVYTTCQSSCPLITQKMQTLERKLPAALSGKVRFLLFSFDPKRDTVPALGAYAVKRHLDSARWLLLTAPEGEARTLASVIDFRYKELANGDFSHSNQITLLDQSGRIVAQTSDLANAPEALLAKMLPGSAQ